MRSRTLKRNITILESWEDGLARIGEVIVHFQRIEEAISQCIAAMVSGERPIGEIVTSELSFRAKVDVFRALFLHRSRLANLPSDVSELIGRLFAAEQRRNVIVHSCWDANYHKPTTIKRQKVACKSKKGLHKVMEEIEPEELEEDIRDFDGVADDLLYFMDECLPKYARRLR
jgi:F0F1-type ATP synthase delta subunit